CWWSLSIHAQPAWAQAISAVVDSVEGRVELIFKDGKRITLKKGDRLEPNQAIESAQGGHAVLVLDDGSKFEIFQATRIEINELIPEEQSKFSLSLFFGRVVAKLNKLRGDDVAITPTMVAGVRGTDFSIGVAEDGATVLSVTAGQVAVSTDQAGEKTSQVDLSPGQEVIADKPGAVLTPQPLTAATMDEWKAFRNKRIEGMKTNLPEIIAKLEKDVDPRLATLDKIKAMPQDRAEVLKKLDEKLAALGPADAAEKAKLVIQTHMEAANVLGLVQRFRVERMRLNNTFVQTEHLKSLLPSFAEQLGPEYKSVDDGLKRILARQEEVKAKEVAISKDFKDNLAPAQPLLNKFMSPFSK
ncbi:MAG: FecR domain-containing protein, partial [Deltaproteobacteria bacterium]|nr:FecR domain-containing protein [Deltaproteobacteria bacterium]